MRFTCEPGDLDVIAPPVAARQLVPEWFKQLPGVDPTHLTARDNGLTVKRCIPFLDAMTTGWVLPLAATVRLDIRNGGADVEAGWEFDKVMVSNHSQHQISGSPFGDRPPMKFHNYWSIRTPPGWSCLFVAPLNRPDPVVEVLAGIVDTDVYTSYVNFPFVCRADAGDGVHQLERGRPLVQVIPFRRDDGELGCETRAEAPDEQAVRVRVHRSTSAGTGWYRRASRTLRSGGRGPEAR